ncbi:hypothetical protein [Spiroplasma endosymbiont of Danaus chrysippus]|uniref:hypothetical protein n=1 Tax=Spiroplasma endosymbiont of Danaus chrysippus TaxID=2691041 RepID=UPI00157B3E12|nr:hypothetical protein [Spiroplasma endosymbiont of Danaus chrysippus]
MPTSSTKPINILFCKNKQNPIKKEKNQISNCTHKYQELCQLLLEFHFTRKGQIYGYYIVIKIIFFSHL